MLSVPFPYFPAFVDGALEFAGDISPVVFAYKVNNGFSRVRIGTIQYLHIV
jgi:hypothetical protein